LQTLHLKPQRHVRIAAGHLWAFAGEITEKINDFDPGDPVVLCEARGKVLGRGYINPHSLIAIRLLTRGEEVWDDKLFNRRIEAALSYRESICAGWEARRLIYAESDGLPGLIVDQYSEHLVLQSLTAGIERRLDEITAALVEVIKPQSIYLRGDTAHRLLEGLPQQNRVLYGDPPSEVCFKEDDAVYSAHLHEGQKTGFYLDQRFNRSLLRNISSGKRVLDLFSYTGAWGIRGLLEGAREAVMVDSSKRAGEWGMEDARRNSVARQSLFVNADVGEFLDECITGKDKFDLVILDPPGLIASRKNLASGSTVYKALHQKVFQVVAAGGWLVSCSCSHHLQRDQHLAIIGEAASKAGRRIRLARSGGHPPDHPILPGHPETEYLKCWLFCCE
jgi:23S rRNA (cytosine1962-C5)-methyltransferase